MRLGFTPMMMPPRPQVTFGAGYSYEQRRQIQVDAKLRAIKAETNPMAILQELDQPPGKENLLYNFDRFADPRDTDPLSKNECYAAAEKRLLQLVRSISTDRSTLKTLHERLMGTGQGELKHYEASEELFKALRKRLGI